MFGRVVGLIEDRSGSFLNALLSAFTSRYLSCLECMGLIWQTMCLPDVTWV